MDDKLILCVFNCPELYNVTLPNYRCTESRTQAWRNISGLVGLTSDECKRKWKSLRDRYVKEIRMEIKSKQQGEMLPSQWKYRQLLNFIAPFIGSRIGTAEMGNDEEQDNPDDSSANVEGDTTCSQAFMKAQLAILTKTPPIGKLGRKRRLMKEAPSPPSSPTPTKRQATDNDSSRPRDEDELFLLSFVPALKRLAPQKRCEAKIRIQQIMYEAEFSVAESEKVEKLAQSEISVIL